VRPVLFEAFTNVAAEQQQSSPATSSASPATSATAPSILWQHYISKIQAIDQYSVLTFNCLTDNLHVDVTISGATKSWFYPILIKLKEQA
jgi:hypothetical protein